MSNYQGDLLIIDNSFIYNSSCVKPHFSPQRDLQLIFLVVLEGNLTGAVCWGIFLFENRFFPMVSGCEQLTVAQIHKL